MRVSVVGGEVLNAAAQRFADPQTVGGQQRDEG